VRVIFPSLEELNAIRIPQQAVQELQGKRSVYVVDAEGKAAYREIIANTRLGNDWVVESGLAEGDKVIVEGAQKVRPGAPVKVGAPTADASGGAAKAGDAKGDAKAEVKSEAAKDAPKKSDSQEPVKSDPYAAKGSK
jgi:membrane fusion protein (multidrug efflux system)